MKNLLKIFLLSSSLYACSNSANQNTDTTNETDSVRAFDSAGINRNRNYDNTNKNFDFPDASELEQSQKEREITLQITSALLFSKKEINLLRSEISDSLTKSGLPAERRSLFVKTIQQLEASTNLINKELENILVTDLQKNRDKLSGIVKKMKSSEKELGAIIARLDKINSYIDVASTLIQSLVPAVPAPVKKPQAN